MNLRSKTLLIFGLTLFLATAVILGLSFTVLIGSYSSFEERATKNAVEDVLKALNYKLSTLESICGDWSRWNETYEFVQDGNSRFINENLNPESLGNLKLDLMVFIDENGKIVHATGYNATTSDSYEVPDEILQKILSEKYFFTHTALVSSRSGYLSLNSSPIMLVSQPILTSTFEGPAAGTLIFGMFLDQNEIRELADYTSLNFTILSANTLPLEKSLQDQLVSSHPIPRNSSLILIQPSGPDTIYGYTTLPDTSNTGSYIIEVTGTRDIYNQGLSTIGSFVVFLIIICFLLITIALLSIDRLVLKRLAILILRTRERNASLSDGEDPLLDSDDELSELARALTPVLLDITRSEQELRESEARYRNVVETQTEFICRFTPDGRHLYANQAYCQYFGRTITDLIHGSFHSTIHPDDKGRVKEHFASLTPDHPVAAIEQRVIMPSGETRWQQWTDLAIFDTDGKVSEYQSVGMDITDRKQSEENLNQVLSKLTTSEHELREALRISEENEQKYRDLADSLPEFVFEVDTAGRLQFLNQLGFQVSGYKPADLNAGLDAVFLVAPEDRGRLAENMKRVMAGERISGQEYTGLRRDKTRFPIVTYSVRVVKDGVVTGLRGFAIDISERKLMEASNRKLAYIVQHTAAGIISGSQETIDVINPAYAQMHGYTSEELSDTPPFSLFSPDVEKEFHEYYRRAELEGHVVFEADHLHRDGTRIPTLNDLTVIPNKDGSPGYWVLHVQDITEHRLAWKILMESESLRESHRQLRDVISRLPDATFVIDKDGWVILWNAAMEQLSKIPAENIIGRGKYEYAIPFYGEARPLLIDLVLKPALDPGQYYSGIIKNGETLSVEEYLSDTVNGPMYLSSVANPLYDAHGTIIGAIESIRDISARKTVEKALIRTNEKLNLLSSITRHDIRNRITVLFGILPLVKRMSTSTDMLEMINMLEKAAYAIRDQIEFTRDYQDMGVHAPEWKDAGQILDIISHQGLIYDIRLENELHGLIVLADPLLERVFYNLVDNAIRHGGKITRISASYKPDKTGILIVFEDNGSGIPEDLKEKIFERGYGKNTGLGLFLVREILSITGIHIRETGVAGEGARFEMHIPDGSFRFE